MQTQMAQPTSIRSSSAAHRSRRGRCAARRARAGQFRGVQNDASIRGGERWLNALAAGGGGCAAFVVLVSRDGVRRWVRQRSVALVRHLSPPRWRAPADLSAAAGRHRARGAAAVSGAVQATGWSAVEPLPLASHRRTAGVSQFPSSAPFEGCPSPQSERFRPQKDARLFSAAAPRRSRRWPVSATARGATGKPCRWRPADESIAAGLQIEGNGGGGKSSLVRGRHAANDDDRQGALWARTGFWTPHRPDAGQDPLAMLAEAAQAGGRRMADLNERLAARPAITRCPTGCARKQGRRAFLL